MTRSALVATVAATAVLLVGCGAPGPDVAIDPPAPDQAVSEPLPVEPPNGDGGGAERVEPSPGMVDVRPRPWDEADVVDDDPTRLEVFWTSGVAPCHVLDRVEVEATEETVTVTLFEGHAPSDEPQACIQIAVRKSTIVELDEPIGERELVDGADAAEE